MNRIICGIALVASAVFLASSLSPALAADTLAASRDVPASYTADQNVSISVTITYTGTLTALGIEETLPAGWTFVSADAPVKPPAGSTGTLHFLWVDVPASPVTLNYTAHVPAGQTGCKTISGEAVYRRTGDELRHTIANSSICDVVDTPTPTRTATRTPTRTFTPPPDDITASRVFPSPRCYYAGLNVQITVITVNYQGTLTALSIDETVPAGWTLVSASSPIRPVAGSTGTLHFSWTTVPASPVVVTYTLLSTSDSSGCMTFSGQANYSREGKILKSIEVIADNAICECASTATPTRTFTPNPLSTATPTPRQSATPTSTPDLSVTPTATATGSLAEQTLSAARNGPGCYNAETSVACSVTINYTGILTGLSVEETIPAGWSYVGGSANADIGPPDGTSGALGFIWIVAPTSPAVLSYALHAPSEESGDQTISGLVRYCRGGADLEYSIPNTSVAKSGGCGGCPQNGGGTNRSSSDVSIVGLILLAAGLGLARWWIWPLK